MTAPCASRSEAGRPARRRVAAAAGLALLLAGGPAGAQSLWTSRSGSLVGDIKAGRAGDILTIVIDEQSAGSKAGETTLSRDSSFSSEFTPPPFPGYPKWLADALFNFKVSGTGQGDYKGGGQTSRTDRATAIVSAKIMRVLDNGNMVVEGRRLVKVHDEALTLVLSGLVRPQDVGADNVIRSSQIAEAEIRIEGHGVISQRQQPGLFHRLWSWIWPF
jgi:flagellar L-ring protein precursor FlgH